MIAACAVSPPPTAGSVVCGLSSLTLVAVLDPLLEVHWKVNFVQAPLFRSWYRAVPVTLVSVFETSPVASEMNSTPLAWAMTDCSFFVTAGRQAFTAAWPVSCAYARSPTQMAHANADATIRVCGTAAVLPA